ncbi:MAG: hypothetical protein ABIR26_04125 [Ramlibacter sp.]
MKLAIVLSCAAALVLVGCAYGNMTSFRKHGASLEDERRDWGLCGGDFHTNGAPRVTPDGKVVGCMRNKGYQTLNDYYVEQKVSFVNLRNPEKKYVPTEALEQCGFSQFEKKGLCSEFFVEKAKLPATIRCLSSWGFEPTIPDQGGGFRIVDDVRALPPNFCLYLTPRNGKGGVTFNGWRWE